MDKTDCTNAHAGRSSVVVGALDQVGAVCIAMCDGTRPLDGPSLHGVRTGRGSWPRNLSPISSSSSTASPTCASAIARRSSGEASGAARHAA
jgi:hypothetical protein